MDYLEEIKKFKECKDFNAVISLYKRALINKPENGELHAEFGVFLHKNGLFNDGLEHLIKAYELGKDKKSIYEFIIDGYYLPKYSVFHKRFEKNIEILSRYQFFNDSNIPTFDQLPIIFIPFNEKKSIEFYIISENFGKIIYLDQKQSLDVAFENNLKEIRFGDNLILKDEFNTANIKFQLDKNSSKAIPVNNNSNSNSVNRLIYLYYSDVNTFYSYLQIMDFSFIEESKVVFLFGQNDLKRYSFCQQNVCSVPKFLLNFSANEIEAINNVLIEGKKGLGIKEEENRNYYKNYYLDNFHKRLINSKPRILFVGSRYHNSYMNCTLELQIICNDLGIPNDVILNENSVYGTNDAIISNKIFEFKPDILFLVNQIRQEYESLKFLGNLICVSWIQDILPQILNKELPNKLGKKDILINIFTNMKEFKSYGFAKNKIFEAPIPVNGVIYKDYELSKDELNLFETDICSVSNKGAPLIGVQNIIGILRNHPEIDSISKILRLAYNEAYERIFNGESMHEISKQMNLLSHYINQENISLDENVFFDLCYWFKVEVIWRMNRSIPFEWLKDAGYKFKLWGREWGEHPNLKEFSNGVAPSGERLSKILNASKIYLGTNLHLTAHPRVYESILSNAFYLGMNIPKQYDVANVRLYLKEDEDIVFAYNKDDLLRKVDYYLNNANKRKEILESGRSKIKESLTYGVFIKKLLSNISKIVNHDTR